jgi:hypothetical protein
MKMAIKVASALLPLAALAAPAARAQNTAGVALRTRPVPEAPAAPAAVPSVAFRAGEIANTPPAPWAAQDPADSLYRAAREALNQGENSRAAELFRSLPQRFPASVYAADALYWEAFARYRIGGGEQFRQALAVLERQRTAFPNAATRADAQALATRIRGELARLGDAEAASSITRTAAGAGQSDAAAGKSATEPASACSAEDSEIRTAALNALVQMDAARATPVLRQVLARRDGCSAALRSRAVLLVSQIASPELDEVLLEAARKDPDAGVRRSAINAISQVAPDRSVPILEGILRTPADSALHDRVLLALSQQKDPRAQQILRTVAEQESYSEALRSRAIRSIGDQSSAENAAFLRNLYGRLKSEQLKDRIFASLAQMPNDGNAQWLLTLALDTTETIRARKRALSFASDAGIAIQDLVALYRRMSNPELKGQLISIFSDRKEPAAFDQLVEIARREPDTTLRKRAISWLSHSKDPRAAQVLHEIITGT